MITLFKGTYNIVESLTFNSDMTNKTVECRIKKKIEDTTLPLLSSTVVFTSVTTTSSVGYVELDLSAIPTLTGDAAMDFKITDSTAPTKKFYIKPFSILIQPTLKP